MNEPLVPLGCAAVYYNAGNRVFRVVGYVHAAEFVIMKDEHPHLNLELRRVTGDVSDLRNAVRKTAPIHASNKSRQLED